jgi:hypothetical protein
LRTGRVAGWLCALLLALAGNASAQSWLSRGGGMIPAREPAGYLISRTPHPAVARIIAQEKDGVSFGTGSLVNVYGEQALVLTNWHVVRDANPNSIYVFFADGYQTAATVVKADRDWDLAALSIRKPPTAQPIAIARTAPRAGDWLCIAGYGSGDYRAAAGRCTQYVSPATNLPYEMVEVGAEARQGDSGGPIFNEQGELAGVLFGSGQGTTSGSYAGRVLNFLQGVVPADQPLVNAQTPAANPLTNTPAADAHLFAAAPLLPSDPSSPPLSASATGGEIAPIPSTPRTPLPLVPLPEKSAVPLTLVNGEEPLEDRTALRPTEGNRGSGAGLDGRDIALAPREGPLAAEALNIVHTPLPSRMPNSAPLESAPADQLIAAAWKQVGGSTLFDQGKTLLAILGVLGLLFQFWRMNSRPDAADDD